MKMLQPALMDDCQLRSVGGQGDQIGRIFAFEAIVFGARFKLLYLGVQIMGLFCPLEKVMY
jgi:hypothetical protein